MFPEQIDNLNSFQGVSAVGGSMANVIIETPEPMRLHRVTIEYKSDNLGTVMRRTKADMLAEIDYLEIYVNNKLQRPMTLAEIFEDLELRGEVIEDGLIPIVWERIERLLGVEREATDFFTEIGDRMVIKVKLKASTTPELTAKLTVDRFAQGSNGDYPDLVAILRNRGTSRQLIETVRKDTINVTKTGLLNVGLQAQARSISCIKLRSSNVSYITVYRGVDKKWEGTPADFDIWMKRQGYTPQAGVIHFSPEFWSGGSVAAWYNFRGQQLRFELTMTAATSFQMDIHEVGDAVR